MNPLRRLIPWPRPTKTARNATPAYTIAVVALTTDDQSKRLLSQFAVRGQWDLAFARTIDEALALLRTGQPAVLLCDRDLPDLDWRIFIEQVAGSRTGSAVILTSFTCDEYLWDDVIQRGGYDVLGKPLQQEHTLGAVNLAWLYARSGWRAAAR
jgi:DNA-binding NtrC family response regulator